MTYETTRKTSFLAHAAFVLASTTTGVAMAGINLPPPSSDEDFHASSAEQQELGKLLFFDKILSGNMNISCATCHHPLAATGDGLSLPIGEGGLGLGVTRDTGSGGDAVHERVPRNAPHVFAIGALEFDTMFHDGRVAVDPSQPSGFLNPAGDNLPVGVLNTVLGAQAMFPVTSATEMAGQAGENPIADAAAVGDLAGPGGVWAQLADRLRAIPEYVTLFTGVYDDVNGAGDITYAHAAQAIAAFESSAWKCNNSRFDQYLNGDRYALTKKERHGMYLFYGEANCASCHSGTFQTDQDFHAIAMPQIGPGKGDNQDGYSDGQDDFGRERVTGNSADRYKFRTPTLRMVAQTAPWGHDGAYDSLEAVLRHHLDPAGSLANYDTSQIVVPSRADLDAKDLVVQNDAARRAAIADASELGVTNLSDNQVESLLAFLHTLTDNACIDLRRNVPKSVPSGLTLAE